MKGILFILLLAFVVSVFVFFGCCLIEWLFFRRRDKAQKQKSANNIQQVMATITIVDEHGEREYQLKNK